MDCPETKDIIEIWMELGTLTKNYVENFDNLLKEQSFRMDIVCDNLLQSAQNSISYNGTVSYNGNAVEKKKLKKEIRISQERKLSTFVVDKKPKKNINNCLLPEMFSSKNGANYMPNKTYDILTRSVSMNILHNSNVIPERSPIRAIEDLAANQFLFKTCLNNKSKEFQFMDKQREKEDIQVYVDESLQPKMTRAMKRKIQEAQIPISLKSVENILQNSPNQVRKKREQFCHKIKTNEKKCDDLEVVKHRAKEQAKKLKENKLKKKMETLGKHTQKENQLVKINDKYNKEIKKVLKNENNNYGLNDISASVSSDDESCFKKLLQ